VLRRSFLSALATCVVAPSLRAQGAGVTPAPLLRLRLIRFQTLLVEMAGVRVLFDPCFSKRLGFGPLLDAPDVAYAPDELGRVDVVCISSADPFAFDPYATKRLRDRHAACLTGSASVARALRGQGFTKVKQLRPQQSVRVRGIEVTASPLRPIRWPSGFSAFGEQAVGFHLARAGRTFWFAGAPPPLDKDATVFGFAREHAAEAMSCAALGLAAFGEPLVLDEDDAELCARAAKARVRFRLGLDVQPSALGAFLLAQPQAPAAGIPHRVPTVVPLPGTWYRVAPSP
jgi:hypothetical protein